MTGSSRGMGRSIALELARVGASVVLHARRPSEDIATTEKLVAEAGDRVASVFGDLADLGSIEPMVDAAWACFGRADIWINNAGADVLTGETAAWSFEEKLDLLWRVDVLGTVRLSRLVGERMKGSQTRGVILNVGWDQAEQGMAGDSGEMFSTTKGAIMSFTRSLAQSLAPLVRVNCVAPGWIRTAWGEQASEYWQQRAQSEALLERWGTPADVARVMCFLSSPAADFITGQIINVNGGFRYGGTQS